MEKKNNSGDILCLSWCDADIVMNYGQILQALAMMQILHLLSCKKIIYISYFPRKIKSRIKYVVEHINPFNGHLYAYIKTKQTINRIVKDNSIAFYQVMSKNIPKKLYSNVTTMICGSDQIWHPQNFDKNYFLNFGGESVFRFSYAASLPKTKLEKQFKDVYKKMEFCLRKLNCISVREEGSCDFISNLCKQEVQCVLDPTFLINCTVWENLVEKISVPEEYAFVYIPNEMDEKMSALIEKIRSENNVNKVVVVITRGNNLLSNAVKLKYVSVGQFLYLIKNAKCVITSSFHAVVFSSIFHVSFYAYDVPNFARGEDCRIANLLRILDLERRLINFGSIDIEPIDYGSVDCRLDLERKRAFSYIKSNLK